MSGESRCRVSGPLAGMADAFRGRLAELGYSPGGVRRHLRLMADLSHWLAARGPGPGALTGAVAREFRGARRREGRALGTPAGVGPPPACPRAAAGRRAAGGRRAQRAAPPAG